MMRSTLAALLLLASLGLSSTGCLVNRRIADVISHDSYNSYKVQTEDAYYAFFSAWVEWSAWNCYQGKDTFHCTKVEYDNRLSGFKPGPDARPGAAPAAPAAAPAAPATPSPATTSRAPADAPKVALGSNAAGKDAQRAPAKEVVR